MEYKVPTYIRLVMVLLGIVLTVFVMITAKSVLVPLLIAGLLAVLISPLTRWLEQKLRFPKLLAVFVSLIALIAVMAGLAMFFYNQLLGFADDLGAIERRISEMLDSVNVFVEKHIEGAVPISTDNLQQQVFQYIYDNMAGLTQGVIATATTLTIVFIMPVYIFLFLYYRHFLVEFVMRAFNEKYRDKVTKVVEKVKAVVQNYITGMLIVILILSVLNSIALFSLGIKHALLFAVFAGMLNVIPFLGPFIGAVLPITYALVSHDTIWVAFGVFLAFYVIQLAESNFFTPKIVGGKVSMNPFMTILALFIGNFIWGLAGMILFIPGMAILKVMFDEIPGMEPYGFLLGSARGNYNKNEPIQINEKIRRARRRFRI